MPPSHVLLYIPPKGLNAIHRPHYTHPTFLYDITSYGFDLGSRFCCCRTAPGEIDLRRGLCPRRISARIPPIRAAVVNKQQGTYLFPSPIGSMAAPPSSSSGTTSPWARRRACPASASSLPRHRIRTHHPFRATSRRPPSRLRRRTAAPEHECVAVEIGSPGHHAIGAIGPPQRRTTSPTSHILGGLR